MLQPFIAFIELQFFFSSLNSFYAFYNEIDKKNTVYLRSKFWRNAGKQQRKFSFMNLKKKYIFCIVSLGMLLLLFKKTQFKKFLIHFPAHLDCTKKKTNTNSLIKWMNYEIWKKKNCFRMQNENDALSFYLKKSFTMVAEWNSTNSD